MNSISQVYKNLSHALDAQKNPKRAQLDKRFHVYRHFDSLGISSPLLNTLLKPFKKQILLLPLADILEIATACYKKHIEEYALAGNFIVQHSINKFNASDISFLNTVVENLQSWSTVDDFCIDVLQPLLRKYPQEIITLLKQWNSSTNMWKKRASVVAFVRKIGAQGLYTDVALSLCDNLIHDKEDLVRKGVGWCLKDIMRGDKEKVLQYVRTLRKRNVSSTIILYALRDIKGTERKQFLLKSF